MRHLLPRTPVVAVEIGDEVGFVDPDLAACAQNPQVTGPDPAADRLRRDRGVVRRLQHRQQRQHLGEAARRVGMVVLLCIVFGYLVMVRAINGTVRSAKLRSAPPRAIGESVAGVLDRKAGFELGHQAARTRTKNPRRLVSRARFDLAPMPSSTMP